MATRSKDVNIERKIMTRTRAQKEESTSPQKNKPTIATAKLVIAVKSKPGAGSPRKPPGVASPKKPQVVRTVSPKRKIAQPAESTSSSSKATDKAAEVEKPTLRDKESPSKTSKSTEDAAGDKREELDDKSSEDFPLIDLDEESSSAASTLSSHDEELDVPLKKKVQDADKENQKKSHDKESSDPLQTSPEEPITKSDFEPKRRSTSISPTRKLPPQSKPKHVQVVESRSSTDQPSTSSSPPQSSQPQRSKDKDLRKEIVRKKLDTKTKSTATILKKKKEIKEFKLGCVVVNRMSFKELRTFLDKLSEECSPLELKPHDYRFANMKWSNVAFNSYTDEECRAAWRFLRTSTRKFRIMSELVQEVKLAFDKDVPQFKAKLVESLPGFPPNTKSISPFHVFLKEKWDTRSGSEMQEHNYFAFQMKYKRIYDDFTEDEKKLWEDKHMIKRDGIDGRVDEYFEQHPDLSSFKAMYTKLKSKPKSYGHTFARVRDKTKKVKREGIKTEKGLKDYKKPSLYRVSRDFPDAPQLPMNSQAFYINSRLEKLNLEESGRNLTECKLKYSEKWGKLSDRKKGKWIDKCIEKCEEYRLAIEAYQAEHPGFKPPQFKIVQKVTKTELAIWLAYKQCPARPPITVMELLETKLASNEEYQNLTLTQLKNAAMDKWNLLSSTDQELYRMHFKKLALIYRKDIEEFYETVPELIKPCVYARVPKKYRSGLVPPGGYPPEAELKIKPELPTGSSLRKKPTSAAYVDDDSSTTSETSTKIKKTKLLKRPKASVNTSIYNDLELEAAFPLPALKLESPEQKYSTSFHKHSSRSHDVETKYEPESPPKKKKKKKHQNPDNEQDQDEYIVGHSSHFDNRNDDEDKITPETIEEYIPKKKHRNRNHDEVNENEFAGPSSKFRENYGTVQVQDDEEEVEVEDEYVPKKKHKKKRKVKTREYIEDEDDDDNDEGHNHEEVEDVEKPEFSGFPTEDWNRDFLDEDSEAEEYPGLTEKEKRKIQKKINKEYRDKVVAKYEESLRKHR